MSSLADTESSSVFDTIRTNTSEWTDMVLPNIGIKFDTCAPESINKVFSKGVLHFIEHVEETIRSEVVNLFWFRSEEDEEKKDCFEHAVLDVFDIDCYHIDDISISDIMKLKQIEKSNWIDNFVAKSDRCQRFARERICRELSASLKTFVWQLLYMHRRSKGNKSQELSEGMFQELFVTFARTFGLNIVSSPSVENYLMKINEKDFVAKPDAIICHPTTTGDDKICAVIGVKGCSQDEGSDHTRNLTNMPKGSNAPHIGSDLKGQHCGQFLCTLPYSAFGKNGMFGFIIQGTKVTFTAFKADDGYYDNLCSGHLHQKEAFVTYSEEYNILRKEDRKLLVQTFLDIGKLMDSLCEM
ncbi:uncharacterized protein LOC127720472 [Mytilus californianus]|uniref:uncharacterized protein LOC127720472 n=1 Tax=Mytilus californianus TaxID=6549 RepID=UPI002247C058|nr:uncharacterized protein LOC127720472 [Mytilus californianus]